MSININVTQATGGSFSAAGVTTDSINLTVGGGIGPPGAGNVALAAGDGILIASTANVATINCTVEGVPESVLENLSNVLSGNATTGDVLAWNGTTWAADSNFATLTYVDNAVANLVDAAPGALDTLNELAAAIGDDANFSATITTSLASKAAANHTHTFQEITNGTATVTGNLTLDPSTGGVIVSGGTSAGSLTLNCENNTHGVTIESPAHSENATYTLTLPSSAGSANQVLTTDGTGSLSWSNGSSGSGGISWTTPAPGNSSDSGSAGDVAYGGQYFYLHNGTQWNRVLLASFGSVPAATSRLLTEISDTLLTESGDYLSHDGNATTSSGNWTQLGSDIDGTAAAFGNAVAMSSNGTRFVAGDSLATTETGLVKVYEWSGSSWSQVGSDIQGQYTYDRFGSAVAISSDGSRIVSGARYSDNGSGATADLGTVQVFDWSGSAWSQVGATLVGEAAGDNFGQSVSISSNGSRIAVGAAGNDGAASGAGHVRVFSWSGSAWSQLGADIDGQYASDASGTAVAISGDGATVAIGAPGNDGGGTDSGSVRVFVWSGSAWAQRGSDINGSAASDQSGSSVSLSSDGTRLAIGSPYMDFSSSANVGGVAVYSWSGSAWTQLGSTIFGETAGDRSGTSVSISDDGSIVAVSSPYNSDSATNAGTTRVYQWSGSAWVKLSTNMDGEAASDFSGDGHQGIALSGDGDTVAIGSAENGLYGHVRVYALQ